MNNLRITFFGTPDIGVLVLEELERAGIVPTLIVTNPDTPQGRKMLLTETPVAQFARERNITVLKPVSLKDMAVQATLADTAADLFIVAAYGKIIPRAVLDMPKHGTLNMHPSLLPKLRGASPIRSAILDNEFPTGVSIMKLTEGLDEGPVLAQEVVPIAEDAWPLKGRDLDVLLARAGGALLARTIPDWMAGAVEAHEQNHSEATYTKKITKDMARIDLDADPMLNLRKIRAFDGWPQAFFFHTRNGVEMRVKIVDAYIENGVLRIIRVIPEGKKEMAYEDFLRSA